MIFIIMFAGIGDMTSAHIANNSACLSLTNAVHRIGPIGKELTYNHTYIHSGGFIIIYL